MEAHVMRNERVIIHLLCRCSADNEARDEAGANGELARGREDRHSERRDPVLGHEQVDRVRNLKGIVELGEGDGIRAFAEKYMSLVFAQGCLRSSAQKQRLELWCKYDKCEPISS